VAQGWSKEDNQAAYCTDSSAQSAGGGFCQFNRMTFTANVSARDQVETYWPAFRAAIIGGNVSSVMCSYNAVTQGGDEPASVSEPRLPQWVILCMSWGSPNMCPGASTIPYIYQ
jgi:hypothetical protein